jgi:dTDP-D-glucose 4,6-dehydratase
MKTVLVARCAYFTGSNFAKIMMDKYPKYELINVGTLTYIRVWNIQDI